MMSKTDEKGFAAVTLDEEFQGVRGLLKKVMNPIRPLLIPLARVIIRYTRLNALRRYLWGVFSWSPYAYNEVRTAYGLKMSGNSRDLIQKYLYFFGIWEKDIIQWSRERLAPGDVFVDVGANIGWYTLATSDVVGESGKVVAVEASPNIYQRLLENVNRNRLNNVRALNFAASNECKRVPLFDGGSDNIGETTTVPGVLDVKTTMEVEAKPLGSILTRDELERVRLIKIDVEGAELEVLQGALQVLDEMPHEVEIITEVSPERLEKQGQTVEQLIDTLGRKGFFPYLFTVDNRPPAYLYADTPARPQRLHGSLDHENTIVFSRKDVASL